MADGIGEIIGTGPGRGYALFFMVLGAFVIGISILAWFYSPLRNLETDIPDVEIDLEEEHEAELVADEDIAASVAVTVHLDEDISTVPDPAPVVLE